MLVDKFNTDRDEQTTYEQSCPGPIARQYELEPENDQRTFNSLSGRLSSDRVEHENIARHGALAHWRRNTTKQQRYDDQVLHAGMASTTGRTTMQHTNVPYAASEQTPGMGLDGENLQSFLTTGTHFLAQPMAQPTASRNSHEQAQTVTDLKLPVQTEEKTPIDLQHASTIASKYRGLRSPTFTNLLARPLTESQ